MWVDRKTYETLLLDNAKLREESRVLNQTNHQQETTISWFMVRVTQLEKERAQLLFNYTGVKVETPEYQPAPRSSAESLNPTPSFDDIGDAEATKLGVGWDSAGMLATLRATQRS
jgi:hypothetical protein